jgi:hypothetical protein
MSESSAQHASTRLTTKSQNCVHQFRWWTAGLQELIEPQLAEVFEAS